MRFSVLFAFLLVVTIVTVNGGGSGGGGDPVDPSIAKKCERLEGKAYCRCILLQNCSKKFQCGGLLGDPLLCPLIQLLLAILGITI